VAFGAYCSSDLWTGTIANSSVGGWSFLGSNHLPAMVADLSDPSIIPYPNLANATELLFGGSSAGAFGAFQNANRFKTLAPWIPSVKVAIDAGNEDALGNLTCIDSSFSLCKGWAPEIPPYTGPGSVSTRRSLDPRGTLNPWGALYDASCAAAHSGSKLQMQECTIGSIIYPFMQFPTFVHQALTDATISNLDYGVPKVAENTSLAVIEYLLAYANTTKSELIAANVSAAFSEMCYEHTALGASVSPVSIFGSTSVLQALGNFYYERVTVHLVDCCTEFNCNPTCASEVCPTSVGTCGPYISTCPDVLAGSTSTTTSSPTSSATSATSSATRVMSLLNAVM